MCKQRTTCAKLLDNMPAVFSRAPVTLGAEQVDSLQARSSPSAKRNEKFLTLREIPCLVLHFGGGFSEIDAVEAEIFAPKVKTISRKLQHFPSNLGCGWEAFRSAVFPNFGENSQKSLAQDVKRRGKTGEKFRKKPNLT